MQSSNFVDQLCDWKPSGILPGPIGIVNMLLKVNKHLNWCSWYFLTSCKFLGPFLCFFNKLWSVVFILIRLKKWTKTAIVNYVHNYVIRILIKYCVFGNIHYNFWYKRIIRVWFCHKKLDWCQHSGNVPCWFPSSLKNMKKENNENASSVKHSYVESST